MALSYDELDVAYRASLRREVQWKARCEQLERRLLEESGRHMQGQQQLTEDLTRMRREWQAQDTGHQLDRIAREARPAIALESGR